jgi:hypothetical protein
VEDTNFRVWYTRHGHTCTKFTSSENELGGLLRRLERHGDTIVSIDRRDVGPWQPIYKAGTEPATNEPATNGSVQHASNPCGEHGRPTGPRRSPFRT